MPLEKPENNRLLLKISGTKRSIFSTEQESKGFCYVHYEKTSFARFKFKVESYFDYNSLVSRNEWSRKLVFVWLVKDLYKKYIKNRQNLVLELLAFYKSYWKSQKIFKETGDSKYLAFNMILFMEEAKSKKRAYVDKVLKDNAFKFANE